MWRRGSSKCNKRYRENFDQEKPLTQMINCCMKSVSSDCMIVTPATMYLGNHTIISCQGNCEGQKKLSKATQIEEKRLIVTDNSLLLVFE